MRERKRETQRERERERERERGNEWMSVLCSVQLRILQKFFYILCYGDVTYNYLRTSTK